MRGRNYTPRSKSSNICLPCRYRRFSRALARVPWQRGEECPTVFSLLRSRFCCFFWLPCETVSHRSGRYASPVDFKLHRYLVDSAIQTVFRNRLYLMVTSPSWKESASTPGQAPRLITRLIFIGDATVRFSMYVLRPYCGSGPAGRLLAGACGFITNAGR
jgi:hypothetical protein